MRADVGSIPLMCILSTLSTTVFGYLPTEDLTNALPNSISGFPSEIMIPGEVEEEVSSPEDETDNEDSIYRKKATTFRRRNINAFGGRVPFGRMAYKSGYGSNRFAPRNGGGHSNGLYERERNPYGTVNMGNGPGYPYPEEYNVRPAAPYSGLIGGSRAGYYGSTVGMRRSAQGGPLPQMRKTKMPTDFAPDYPTNDLMGSFNGGPQGGNPAIPSLRELATYASRYGPQYLRERFGASENIERNQMPYGGQMPHMPRGGQDFSMNIATNQWNGGAPGGPAGIMSRDVDSYQHDDTPKTNLKKQKPSKSPTVSTTTSKPKSKKARAPTKKVPKTTTTAKPKKNV